MKKTLILIRHATAEDQSFFMNDFDRKLNSKGTAEAELMGKWLLGQAIIPDCYITSEAPRAYKTAEVIAGQFSFKVSNIRSTRNLYDGGPRSYLNSVNSIPEEFSHLVLVGHNPDISFFGEYLSGADLGSMSKGGVLILEFEDQQWSEISAKTGRFISYTTPKQVKNAS